MNLKFYKLLFITSLFYSVSLYGKEIKYQFRWLSIPVANFSISYASSIHKDDEIGFELSTIGPLSIYRKYKSTGYIKYYNEKSWIYYLKGFDRGQPEEKEIKYSRGNPPHVSIFIDDKGEHPIESDLDKDHDSIDPFSVLINIIKSYKEEKTRCKRSELIFDGKRRYSYEIIYLKEELMKIKKSDTKLIKVDHCVISFGDSVESESPKGNVWPFNFSNNELKIDIWFSKEEDQMPIRFQIETPIGKISGNTI